MLVLTVVAMSYRYDESTPGSSCNSASRGGTLSQWLHGKYWSMYASVCVSIACVCFIYNYAAELWINISPLFYCCSFMRTFVHATMLTSSRPLVQQMVIYLPSNNSWLLSSHPPLTIQHTSEIFFHIVRFASVKQPFPELMITMHPKLLICFVNCAFSNLSCIASVIYHHFMLCIKKKFFYPSVFYS